jgi:flagellar hook protein FlgE
MAHGGADFTCIRKAHDMTISSSLNAGVAGLNVNASRLATIADNIANSGTYGYKRSVADFHSMVISNGSGTYSQAVFGSRRRNSSTNPARW